MSKTLVAATAKPMILSLLSRGESYGYKILQDVLKLSGGTLAWSEALLYPVLHKLEKDGLIRSRWGSSEEKRMRKYYSLTESGRLELEGEKARWLNIHEAFVRLWTAAESLE